MMPYLEHEPTASELASVRLPRLVTAGADNRDPTTPGHWRCQSAAHLAARFGTSLVELPGPHLAYLEQPSAFAEALRPCVAALT
jgi:pimeloyl-ACP methyl ester carboxylesterase